MEKSNNNLKLDQTDIPGFIIPPLSAGKLTYQEIKDVNIPKVFKESKYQSGQNHLFNEQIKFFNEQIQFLNYLLSDINFKEFCKCISKLLEEDEITENIEMANESNDVVYTLNTKLPDLMIYHYNRFAEILQNNKYDKKGVKEILRTNKLPENLLAGEDLDFCKKFISLKIKTEELLLNKETKPIQRFIASIVLGNTQ